ncbi:hypothetical protein ARMSODRAFT_1086818 [Armillaria solidipes]|uniref:F-box domain-containing protein n=1 Tax=Armillaria solidipes TaxID=1076256 RepID=A0A2H3BBP9_9AGAR|nr:hypothetical protein ARMSODRAFT_1086818 [Armillaria solidipes]
MKVRSKIAISAEGLPQELIDAIVDELEGQDTVLKNASLVNRSFHSSCQKLIFSHIELKFRPPRLNPYIQFHRLILDSPRIAAFVKMLQIHDFYGQGLESTWFIQDDILIPRIIELLVNLTSITVVAARFITRRSENLSIATRASLFYTPLPRLTKISLVNVIFPDFQELMDLIVDRPTLKELQLLDVLLSFATTICSCRADDPIERIAVRNIDEFFLRYSYTRRLGDTAVLFDLYPPVCELRVFTEASGHDPKYVEGTHAVYLHRTSYRGFRGYQLRSTYYLRFLDI